MQTNTHGHGLCFDGHGTISDMNSPHWLDRYGKIPGLINGVFFYAQEEYRINDIRRNPKKMVAETMLEKAFARIPDGTDRIFHSDQGWQYHRMLREKGVRQSVSRKGSCPDNAMMENFFGLLKSELLYLQEFQSMEHFKQELIEYPDYYSNRRIKAKLKGLPPAIHRQQALSVA